jgi:hypothetical protein
MKIKLSSYFLIFILIASFLHFESKAQTKSDALIFDKTIHDFGKLNDGDAPVSCLFKFTNKSAKPVVIYNVISSCGCTTPSWTKKPVPAGASGEIKVTFLNDQGPYPFDKSLTVYSSLSRKPIILRIRGIVYPKGKSLTESYPVALGPLGIQDKSGFDIGQIEQGRSKSADGTIANTTYKKVNVLFSNETPGLQISVTPNPLPSNSIGILKYTINTAQKRYWGNTTYTADLICNGIKVKKKIAVNCIIIDNFSNYSTAQTKNAPLILEEHSTDELGQISRGSITNSIFEMQNIGHSTLIIRKAEANEKAVKLTFPKSIKPGAKFNVTAKINTAGMSAGEKVFTILLITNSPDRPLVNMFITCNLK